MENNLNIVITILILCLLIGCGSRGTFKSNSFKYDDMCFNVLIDSNEKSVSMEIINISNDTVYLIDSFKTEMTSPIGDSLWRGLSFSNFDSYCFGAYKFALLPVPPGKRLQLNINFSNRTVYPIESISYGFRVSYMKNVWRFKPKKEEKYIYMGQCYFAAHCSTIPFKIIVHKKNRTEVVKYLKPK